MQITFHALFKPLDTVICSPRIMLVKKLMGESVFKALCHIPSDIVHTHTVKTLSPELLGKHVSMSIRILAHHPPMRRGGSYRISGILPFSMQRVELIFFPKGSHTYFKYRFAVGREFNFSGKLETYNTCFRLVHPVCASAEKYNRPSPPASMVEANVVYPLTAGLTSKYVSYIAKQLLKSLKDYPDWHDFFNTPPLTYPSLVEALTQAHNPKNSADLTLNHPARARLLHDEMLAHYLALKLQRQNVKSNHAPPIQSKNQLKEKILSTLPFHLTEGQRNALRDIEHDIAQNSPMLRLLQGDVGCGKTIVAVLAIAHAVETELQAAVLVPTDILATQHFENFQKFFEPHGVVIALLTGRVTGVKRKKILEEVARGTISILIGTHALIQEHVHFQQLGLVLVDEQHRFGVEQRAKLVQKGHHPHVLSMTATPIPRTLLMTQYGDIDLSLIKEKPAERQPIHTTLHSINDIDGIIQKLIPALNATNKAYWVCPLIEESESSDYTAAKVRFAGLQNHFGDKVGLLHGKMKAEEKNAVMGAFKHGDIHLLVSTTVIEVGVDVRTANIMLIEHAEKFGLAQLHQLRGRVGRSDQKAHCLLLYEYLSPIAQERLSVMRKSNDGFYLADADLKLRGGGDITGHKQSGFPAFHFYKGDDYENFEKILERVRTQVNALVEIDPDLTSEQGKIFRVLLTLFEKDTLSSHGG